MQITILGAGTGLPFKAHSPAGHLVRIQEQPLLVDLGPGTLSRLEAAGVSYRDLETILLTHLHADHTLDLALLLQNFDSTPNWIRTERLRLIGCRGLANFYQRLMDAYPGIAPSTFPLELRELGEERLDFPGWSASSFFTGHTPSSLGYRIEAEGKVVAFSGDATLSPGLLELARQADLFVCECSFPGVIPLEGHLAAIQVGRVAREAGVKRLFLVHLYPPAREVNLVDQVRTEYDGPVEIAYDGLTLSL